MIIFLFVFSQYHLKEIPDAKPWDFITSKSGHVILFDIDEDHGFAHYNLKGDLVFEYRTKDEISAACPVPGGYLISWIGHPEYGIALVDRGKERVTSLPKYYAPYFRMHGDQIFAGPRVWAKDTDFFVPITVKQRNISGKSGAFYRPKVIDPNIKKAWLVIKGKTKYAMSPLEPVVTSFNGEESGRHRLDIEWKPYPGRFTYGQPFDWYTSHHRIVGFGKTGEGFQVAVENLDGKTTRIYFLADDLKVEHSQDIPGYLGRYGLYGGTDGKIGYRFDPAKWQVSEVRP
ncbi:MAG: hypothetical protein QNK37_10865 [Acidobacteriota bacterium]|nr:hypothetical protein [Acidobacteriota bacterium]